MKSLKDDGKLVRYVSKKLYCIVKMSKLTNSKADTVVVAMKSFIDRGQSRTKNIYIFSNLKLNLILTHGSLFL